MYQGFLKIGLQNKILVLCKLFYSDVVCHGSIKHCIFLPFQTHVMTL